MLEIGRQFPELRMLPQAILWSAQWGSANGNRVRQNLGYQPRLPVPLNYSFPRPL